MGTESIYLCPAGETAVMAAYDTLLAHWPVPCEMRTIAQILPFLAIAAD